VNECVRVQYKVVYMNNKRHFMKWKYKVT